MSNKMTSNYTLEHGIMAQVQALINPVPCSIDLSHDTRPDYRYQFYLRTQARGVNHDVCDSCDESGDLVCCDSCPAAFHLNCTDPPMDEEDVEKLSTWSCKRCTYTKGQSSVSRSNACKSLVLVRDKPGLAEIFGQLVNEAEKTNPKEFKLPEEYGCIEYALPGTSRLVFKKSNPARSKQTIIEMDNYLVPKPTAQCNSCTRTCRSGPLIKCDMCPMFYHLDCLTPPLTVPPTSIWLCPLHPEPTLEAVALRSTLMSERVRLYDYTSQIPVGNQIKQNFLRKIRRETYTKGRRRTRRTQGRMKIPEVPGHVLDDYGFGKASMSEELEDQGFQEAEVNHSISTGRPGEREQTIGVTPSSTTANYNPLLLLAEAATTLEEMREVTHDEEFDASKIIDQMDVNTIKLLATERLKRLHEESVIKTKEGTASTVGKENKSAVKKRVEIAPATLVMHCVTSGKQFRFTKSSVEIGLGSQVDINLVYSKCKNISKRHAVIHRDPVTNKWELLCYSTYGTMVNRCLYGCNQNASVRKNAKVNIDNKVKELFAQVVKNRKQTLLGTGQYSSPVNTRGYEEKECDCSKTGIWRGATCEQSAEIRVNDIVQFGCQKFVIMSALVTDVD